MPAGTRRELLIGLAAVASAGCMSLPETDDGRGNETDDAGTGESDDGAGSSDAAGEDGTSPATVWFDTDRVREEINTFDVSVRVELRDSTMVRVEAGQHFSETYGESGVYADVTRVELGTTLRAEALTDGEWEEINVAEAPVHNSEGFEE